MSGEANISLVMLKGLVSYFIYSFYVIVVYSLFPKLVLFWWELIMKGNMSGEANVSLLMLRFI